MDATKRSLPLCQAQQTILCAKNTSFLTYFYLNLLTWSFISPCPEIGWGHKYSPDHKKRKTLSVNIAKHVSKYTITSGMKIFIVHLTSCDAPTHCYIPSFPARILNAELSVVSPYDFYTHLISILSDGTVSLFPSLDVFWMLQSGHPLLLAPFFYFLQFPFPSFLLLPLHIFSPSSALSFASSILLSSFPPVLFSFNSLLTFLSCFLFPSFFSLFFSPPSILSHLACWKFTSSGTPITSATSSMTLQQLQIKHHYFPRATAANPERFVE